MVRIHCNVLDAAVFDKGGVVFSGTTYSTSYYVPASEHDEDFEEPTPAKVPPDLDDLLKYMKSTYERGQIVKNDTDATFVERDEFHRELEHIMAMDYSPYHVIQVEIALGPFLNDRFELRFQLKEKQEQPLTYKFLFSPEGNV